MIADKVMYAEWRPMLMDKSIPSDDGLRQLFHSDQMNIILEEVAKKKEELEAKGQLELFPFGLKIIYCTPRSIPKPRMKTEMLDCIKLKLAYPDLICGKQENVLEAGSGSSSYESQVLTLLERKTGQILSRTTKTSWWHSLRLANLSKSRCLFYSMRARHCLIRPVRKIQITRTCLTWSS